MWVVDYPEYCLVNVGRVSGKIKLCLLDKENSWIGEKFHLRAVLTSNNSREQFCSIQVLAIPKDLSTDQHNVKTVQQIIWQMYNRKPLSSLQTIRHLNGNTMDNRAENLALSDSRERVTSGTERLSEQPPSLIYTSCVQQLIDSLPWLNVPDCLYTPTLQDSEVTNLFYSLISSDEAICNHLTSDQPSNRMQAASTLFECHYPPCTVMEHRQSQFDSCGGCKSLRYCSSQCQRLDWAIHKPHCELIKFYQSQSKLAHLQDILYLNQQIRHPDSTNDHSNQPINSQHSFGDSFNQPIEPECLVNQSAAPHLHDNVSSKTEENKYLENDYFIAER